MALSVTTAFCDYEFDSESYEVDDGGRLHVGTEAVFNSGEWMNARTVKP